MYCPYCGALNPSGARFCSSCGAPLPVIRRFPPFMPLISAFVVLAVLAILAFLGGLEQRQPLSTPAPTQPAVTGPTFTPSPTQPMFTPAPTPTPTPSSSVYVGRWECSRKYWSTSPPDWKFLNEERVIIYIEPINSFFLVTATQIFTVTKYYVINGEEKLWDVTPHYDSVRYTGSLNDQGILVVNVPLAAPEPLLIDSKTGELIFIWSGCTRFKKVK